MSGYYGSFRFERDLIRNRAGLDAFVAKDKELRAIARDYSWMILVHQRRLGVSDYFKWTRLSSSAGQTSVTLIFPHLQYQRRTERSLPMGVRVARVRQLRWPRSKVEFLLDISNTTARTLGVSPRTIRLVVAVSDLQDASFAELLYRGGVRTKEIRTQLESERLERVRRNPELDRERLRMRCLIPGDPRLGLLNSTHERYKRATAKLATNTECALRTYRFAVERIDLRPVSDECSQAGVSQEGGTPELPPDLPWPEGLGGPMTLWLQLDLDALPRLPHPLLPDHGRLLVFVGDGEYEDAPEARVLWLNDGPFEARKPPSTARDGQFDYTPLTAAIGLDIPFYYHHDILNGFDYEEREASLDLFSEFDDRGPICMFGHEEDLGASQDDGRYPDESDEAWIALVQSSEERSEWDYLAATVLIHRDDLLARDFSRAQFRVYNAS